ncbi:hypothetical protein [Streptomyces griseosporeus]|uniref:hypothetical protein n=1 Tax=Streptomyces griseosporeus TaxID=1910 RepID=UPI003797B29B
MGWTVAGGMVFGVLLVALGVAALRTGWTLPWARGRVTRMRMYGWGAVLVGVNPVVQGLFYFRIAPDLSWNVRFFSMNALLFTGLLLIGVSQMRLPRRRTTD